MLSLKNRLRKTKDFRNVSSQRRGFKENGLLLKAGASGNSAPRLGVVVSKKVFKQAVRRNRVRRVIREAARHEMELVKRGQDIVLIVLPGFELPSLQETKERLHRLFQKASLFL